MIRNREIFQKDPIDLKLLNDGVADVKDSETAEDLKVLRYELETFVCEGQYAKGLRRILESFLGNLGNPQQPGVWVSGFYGSGKSHLIKMLRALWVNYKFSDGATARGVAHLPTEVTDALKELDTAGKRFGGLRAASGTLREQAGDNARLMILSTVFKSCGLPQQYPLARFAMWLRDEGHLDAVRKNVEKAGKVWEKELQNMYVSTVLPDALIKHIPNFANSPADARNLLKVQYPNVTDVSNDEMVQAIRTAVAPDGKFPCFLIALDEVQQFINDNADLSMRVQEVAETLEKRFEGRLLHVGTGQNALSAMPLLQRLQGRYTVQIDLTDQDVETVTRKVILAKKPDRMPEVQKVLEDHSGEIARHLVGTKIEPSLADREYMVPDYPLLPTRRRFWERVLRAMDTSGTGAQLRTQLKIVHEAVCEYAEKPLGTTVPADFLYHNLATKFLMTGAVPHEIYDLILNQSDGSPAGRLKNRICALVFLIGKLPREGKFDLGIRAKPEVLADLLVEDLTDDSAKLRKSIPTLLDELVEAGHLLQIDEEYHIQTRESRDWDSEFQRRYNRILGDQQRMASERADILQQEAKTFLQISPKQGASKVPRSLTVHFGSDKPVASGGNIPVWVRNGWDETEKSFEADTVAAGTDDPTIFVFIPRRKHDELSRAIASMKAAKETIDFKGTPTTPEGEEARQGMVTRHGGMSAHIKSIVGEILQAVRVRQAGGQEMTGMTLTEMVEAAVDNSLTRLFPQFSVADNPNWEKVIKRVKQGAGDALETVGYKGEVDKHPVCDKILRFVAAGKKGSEVRKEFDGSPYGWSQDAIDGALMVLTLTGHIRAKVNGSDFDIKETVQGKLGQVDFRAETITVSATQRMGVRGLLQAVGIPYKTNEEIIALPALLQDLKGRARQAGGEPPLPATPSTAQIDDLHTRVGNDQLVEVFNVKDALKQKAEDWKKAGEEIQKRLPRWHILEKLQIQADGLPVGTKVKTQAEAIVHNRGLLADPDPVPPLCQELTQSLRVALTDIHKDYSRVFDVGEKALDQSQEWQKLTPEQRHEIRADNRILSVFAIKVGTEQEVLESLASIPLKQWRDMLDALPQRFAQARLDAAKLLQPKAVKVTLPSATLNSEAELDAWLGDVRQQVANQLKNGPVLI